MIVIILLCAAVIGGVFIWLNGVKKADAYEIGGESVPSIKAVDGERRVASVSSKIQDGVKTKTYNFVSDTSTEDTCASSNITLHMTDKESGSKSLTSVGFSNGGSASVFKADNYTDANPQYLVKYWDENGEEQEYTVNPKEVEPSNAS